MAPHVPALAIRGFLSKQGPPGWWYAAPLPKDKAVIALLTDADLLPVTVQDRYDFVNRDLAGTKLIHSFAAQMVETAPIWGFPASSSIRRAIHERNWVAIGEAAAAYDPLSGHGVAAALAKGAAIARLIANNENLSHALQEYADAEWRTFSAYLETQRLTYRRASPRFSSAFWDRRV